MRWLWFLLAIVSWIGASFLADAEVSVVVAIFFSALGIFLIAIAIGGKKGVPWGVGAFVFTGCFLGVYHVPGLFGSSFNWPATKQLLYGLKTGEVVLVYLGLISLLIFLVIVPIYVGRKIWKSVTRKKPRPKDGEEKETKKKAEKKTLVPSEGI